jgi:5-formyltetrahydrofolate cyclo-ligase
MESKTELRKTILLRMSRLSEEEKSKSDALLCKRALDFIDAKNINAVFIYLSTRNEIATENIISSLKSRGVKLYFPRITSFEKGEMQAIYSNELQENKMAILEPKENKTSKVLNLQEYQGFTEKTPPLLVLAPCLYVDTQHTRLGYGGGYYDRFLSDLKKKNVNFTSLCLQRRKLVDGLPNIPQESHDIKIDEVIFG